MRRTGWLIAILAIAVLAALGLGGCSSGSETTEPADEQIQEQIDQTTEQQQQSVDEILNSAQEKVDELVSAVGGLEARVSGLQINSDLQEVQRKLNDAVDEAGDKKKAAIEELSDLFNNLIYRVDLAAGKLPEGGPVRTELEDFSQQLKDVQADLADAAASYEASSTP